MLIKLINRVKNNYKLNILGLVITLPIVTPSFAGTGCSKPASDPRATTKTGHRLVVGTTAPAISDPREPYGPRRSVLSADDAGRPVTAHGQRKNRKITVRPRTAVTAPIMVSTASARDFIGKAADTAAAEAATVTMLRTKIHTAIDAYNSDIRRAQERIERELAEAEITAKARATEGLKIAKKQAAEKLAHALSRSKSTIDDIISPIGS